MTEEATLAGGFSPAILSWWRGEDLNLRPSGYEHTDRYIGSYRCVSKSTSEQGVRQAHMPSRVSPYRPVFAGSLEIPLEDLRTLRSGPLSSLRLNHMHAGRAMGPLCRGMLDAGELGAVTDESSRWAVPSWHLGQELVDSARLRATSLMSIAGLG